MKLKVKIIGIVVILLFVSILSACKKQNNETIISKNSIEQEHSHTHYYSILVSDTATCEKKGIATYKCSKCAETTTEESKPTGHSGTIVCNKCNNLFADLIFNNLKRSSSNVTVSSVDVTTTITYEKDSNSNLCINLQTYYSYPLSMQFNTTFTIKSDGSWHYSTTGKTNISLVSGGGSISANIPFNRLYIYTEKNIGDATFELPIDNNTGDSSFLSTLYSAVKTHFSMSVMEISKACILKGDVTMQNLGFSNF